MCLWLLTACLGLLPSNPSQNSQIVIVQGVPAPILQPTTAATAAPTTITTKAATSAPTTMSIMTTATTPMPPPPTTAAPATTPTSMPPPPTTATPATTRPPIPTVTATTARPSSPGNIVTSKLQTIITMSSINADPSTSLNSFNISLTSPTIFSNSSGGVIVICDNPDAICVFNPDDNTAGQISIDPRLGFTPAAEFRLPPITQNSENPTMDTVVKFPREKRSINTENKIAEYVYSNLNEHRIRKRQSNCRCVTSGTCNNSFGNGLIDIRIVTPTLMPCPVGQEYCCGNTAATIACGTLQTSPSPIITPAAGQASFGEYPWQALILTKQNDYIAGGVLIDQLNIITVIHRLSTYIVSGMAPNVKVRLGEWDAAGTYEPIPFQEYTIAKVFTHPSFNPNTLQYDIAVLRLSAPVPLTPMMGSTTTINRACLPPTSTTTYTGQRCWVAGWGKDMFGMQGQFQQILKKVDVPIVAPATCQTQLQNARLGPTYILDTTSFVCAGGEANKDSCTGDGGSGLVCQVQGQWVVVGLVSWGLGCANANVPAAYVNVAALLPWIQQQVAMT